MKDNIDICDCAFCRDNHEFQIPKDFIHDLMSGNVVIFAGSGISTESKNVLNFTLYEDVVIDIEKEQFDLSFPEVMQEYCKRSNGRIKLLRKIKERFKVIKSFPELYYRATRFHRSMSTIFPVKTIVTTNWDTYFEDECDAIPFVSDEDLAFWDTKERKVLKIHGSIGNYGSIVATSDDYKACQERLHSGILGGVLKTLLATKTLLFVGYSMSDPDFLNIFDFVSEKMKGFLREAYVITPFEQEIQKFEELGLIPIITDGEYFINGIKEHLIRQGGMMPDTIYDHAENLLLIIRQEHVKCLDKYSCFNYPQIIYTASYQDGMIHAIGRLLTLKSSGEYSDPYIFSRVVYTYREIQKEKLRYKKYEDVAYIEGYLNALMFFELTDEDKSLFKHPPLYFAFGAKDDLFTIDDFDRIVEELQEMHKTSYRRAEKIVKKIKSNKGIVFQHPPWL